MNKTLVVWWRYGKEHDPAAGAFRVNPPGVISAHIDQKIAAARLWSAADWRWWQVDDELLIERADPTGYGFGLDTRIYYLVRRGLAVIENIQFPAPNEHWTWYIHVADIFWDTARECWIKQDLFADILVDRGGRETLVIDLDDVATGLDLGLLTPPHASTVLRTTNVAVRAIASGKFPFPEIVRAQAACKELGWERLQKT
jgi:hypothetical protein